MLDMKACDYALLLEIRRDERKNRKDFHLMNRLGSKLFFLQWLFQPIQGGPGLLFSYVIVFHRR
jgi:hypothetical protein